MKQSWIIKFAPFRTSWSEIIVAGTFTLRGVRSPAARKNIKSMQIGDSVFFYQSQQKQAIVGLLEVSREAYPDPTSSSAEWLTCNFRPLASFNPIIPLSILRAEPMMKTSALLRQPRLAVMPISHESADWLFSKLDS